MFARKTPTGKPTRFGLRRVEPAQLEDAIDREHLEQARDAYERGEIETLSLEEVLAKRD
ncbi:MAG TPA: hypothetical protein VF138_07580 [Caulobacteraceae bacterium]